jgi:hypothetical protein
LSFFLLFCLLFNKFGENARRNSPGSEGVRGGWAGAGGRNDTNNVCTYECMNKERYLPSLQNLLLPKLSSVDLHNDLPILVVSAQHSYWSRNSFTCK